MNVNTSMLIIICIIFGFKFLVLLIGYNKQIKTFLSSIFVRFKPVLILGNQILLKKNTGGHLGGIKEDTPEHYDLNQYVTVQHDSVLNYFGEDKSRIYFVVKCFYQCRKHDAPDGCIVYFNRERFIDNIDYKIIR